MWWPLTIDLNWVLSLPKVLYTEEQLEIANYWDENVAARYNGTSVADLKDFLDRNPLAEPRDYIEKMLYDLYGWQEARNDLDHLNSTICVDYLTGEESDQYKAAKGLSTEE